MLDRASGYRFAALVLAISLLIGLSPDLVRADDLNRSQSHRAALIAVGNESDVFDGNRFARCAYSGIADTRFCFATFAPAFFGSHNDAYWAVAASKLFRLNVVSLM